jgi:peptide/nickel transport system ATP-binding protein
LTGVSGAGKSSLARLLTLHEEPWKGTRYIGAADGTRPGGTIAAQWRRRFQLVMQDPGISFAAGWTVGDVLREVRDIWPGEALETPQELLAEMDLPPELLHREAVSLSGGERCRLGIARALGAAPDLLVLDETLAAMDRALQARLRERLRARSLRSGMAIVTIAHDLRTLEGWSEVLMVMEAGKLVESGATERLLRAPSSAALRQLVEASTEPIGARP